MAIPLRYNLRNLVLRWRTTILTVFAIGLVVAVFVTVLSLAQGLSEAFVATGDPLNVLILRRGATAETNSGLERESFRILELLPEVARDALGHSLASLESANLINMLKVGGGSSNAVVRGLSLEGVALRPRLRIVEGRMFQPGKRELVVGAGAAKRFERARVGETIRLVRSDWTIVGRFDDGRSAYDSEFWGEVELVTREFDRNVFSSVLMRAPDMLARESLLSSIASNQRLGSLRARPEVDYYAEQTKNAAPIRFLGMFLAVVMSIGAVFAAMNTMYAAISSRSGEIATLRVLGFPRRTILASFLLESVLLALIGGALGGLLALPMNGVATGTINWGSFSEVAFVFRITPRLIAGGLLFAALMGMAGGFIPALQASRRPIAESLRDNG